MDSASYWDGDQAYYANQERVAPVIQLFRISVEGKKASSRKKFCKMWPGVESSTGICIILIAQYGYWSPFVLVQADRLCRLPAPGQNEAPCYIASNPSTCNTDHDLQTHMGATR